MNSKSMSSERIKRRANYVENVKTIFNMIEHDGLLLPNKPGCIEWLIALKDITVRPTDIWICGYPKSGNTWLSEIVSVIMADGVIDRVRDRPVTERVPNIIYSTKANPIRNYLWFEGITDPRITNNHLPLKYLPRFEGKKGKMIYIVRNPKDVCVSYYHFHHMLGYPAIDWDDFCHIFLDEHWLADVTDFWLAYGTGNHPNVLFIAYEELIADLPAMIATIARFLGKQFTAETVANITTHCSLKTMRNNPMANQSDLITRMGTTGAQFVRKGTIGDWRRHMTDTQSALFDERFGQQLRAIGLRLCDDALTAERCMRETGRIINNV